MNYLNFNRDKFYKICGIFADMLDNNNANIDDYYKIISDNGFDYDDLDLALNFANNILIFK